MYQSTKEIDTNSLIQTARSLKAIAHPKRLAIVELLKDGEPKSVTEIYGKLKLEQAVASQHLGILRERNILEAKREGKHTYYSLKHDCIVDVIDIVLSTLKKELS
ncbi:MAG: ArsR/SmtB family transcription factor [Bacteroidia bacterium]